MATVEDLIDNTKFREGLIKDVKDAINKEFNRHERKLKKLTGLLRILEDADKLNDFKLTKENKKTMLEATILNDMPQRHELTPEVKLTIKNLRDEREAESN